MKRTMNACGLLLIAAGSLLAEEDAAHNANLARIESQFGELDKNKDSMLDEKEVESIPGEVLERMREHGLRQGYPIPRAEFLDAGTAELQTREQKPIGQPSNTPPLTETKSEPPAQVPNAPITVRGITIGRRGSPNKTRVVLELPSEYKGRDKNGDGQIGLYEWERSKYTEFAKLDKNGDGFLTPSELVQRSSSSAAVSPPSGHQDPIEHEAHETFSRMDKNRDGSLGEEEWGPSQRVRPMFDKAGIKYTLPMNLQDFVTSYVKAIQATEGK